MADGTVSVAANSTAVTGTLTSFVAAEGDLLIIGADVGVVKSRDSTTGLTLKQPWAGASVTNAANWIVLPVGPSWFSQVALNLRLNALLSKWESGPVKWDAAGSLAQRANYAGQPVGFAYLAVDPAFTLYVKLANTGSASDWSNGQQLYNKADSTTAAEAARDSATASAASASSNAAATAADRSATAADRAATLQNASNAAGSATSAQTSANNAAATLANAALKGDNADISRLRGINGAGIDFWASETAVTGQGTCDLSAVTTLKVGITISGPITSFGTGAHRFKILRFASTGQLTNGAALALQGGANITTAVGDRALFVSDANGVGYVIGYWRADGTPVAASSIGKALLTAVDAAAARQALGLSIGTNVQAWDADLDAIAALATTAFGRDFIALVDAAAARTKIGAQASLGFAPVQTGTGVGQSASNALKLGYDGVSRIKATVDATDFGALWTDLVAAGSVASDGTYGVQRFPSGWAIIGGTTVAQTDANGIITIAVGLATAGGVWFPLVGSGDFNSSTAQAVAGNTTSTGFSVKFLNSPNSILRVNWIVVGRWK